MFPEWRCAQIGQQLRTGIIGDGNAAAHSRTHIGAISLTAFRFFRAGNVDTQSAVHVVDHKFNRNYITGVLHRINSLWSCARR